MGVTGGGGPGPVLPMLQYQGRLTNPSTGQPVTDGTYAMTFNLYTDSAGSVVWTETKNVSVAGGQFSALVGDVTSLPPSLLNGQELWLGIKVGADAEMTPRQTIFPVAYAMSLAPGAVISGSLSSASVLQAINSGTYGRGLYGWATGTTGVNYGVYGRTSSPNGYAGYFSGDVRVYGDMSVTGMITTSRVAYSTPRVQYFTIGSEGFVPGSNVDYYNTYGSGGAYIVSGSGGMVAPVHLPHDAVVTEFRVYYYDNSAGNLTVTLYRQGFNTSYYGMASVLSSGTPGYSSGVDTVINSATVDNTSYSYMVDAYSNAWDSELRIKAAVIVYTVSEVP